MWIDAHNHLQSPRFAASSHELLAAMQASGVSACVANGTHPTDWENVAALAGKHPDSVFPAFGVHPWQAGELPVDWLEKLRHHLASHPMAGIGEIGLDLWVDEPPLHIQLPVFRSQWELAVELNRPLTIHCLRAWSELLDEMDRLPPHPGRILIHAFGGPPDTAERLLENGCVFSFNGAFLARRKRRLFDWWRLSPKETLLVESDAPDMLPPQAYRHPFPNDSALPDTPPNHPASLAACATAFATARGLTAAELAAITNANFHRWWLGTCDANSQHIHHSTP